MKFSTLATIFASALSVEGFSILPNTASSIRSTAIHSTGQPFFADEDEASTSEEGNDFGSKMPTVYDRLGFDEDKIGIGINPSEVLQWLGK